MMGYLPFGFAFFRRDSALLKQAWLCFRCLSQLASFWLFLFHFVSLIGRVARYTPSIPELRSPTHSLSTYKLKAKIA